MCKVLVSRDYLPLYEILNTPLAMHMARVSICKQLFTISLCYSKKSLKYSNNIEEKIFTIVPRIKYSCCPRVVCWYSEKSYSLQTRRSRVRLGVSAVTRIKPAGKWPFVKFLNYSSFHSVGVVLRYRSS